MSMVTSISSRHISILPLRKAVPKLLLHGPPKRILISLWRNIFSFQSTWVCIGLCASWWIQVLFLTKSALLARKPWTTNYFLVFYSSTLWKPTRRLPSRKMSESGWILNGKGWKNQRPKTLKTRSIHSIRIRWTSLLREVRWSGS